MEAFREIIYLFYFFTIIVIFYLFLLPLGGKERRLCLRDVPEGGLHDVTREPLRPLRVHVVGCVGDFTVMQASGNVCVSFTETIKVGAWRTNESEHIN